MTEDNFIAHDHLIREIFKDESGDINRISLIRNGKFINLTRDLGVRD